MGSNMMNWMDFDAMDIWTKPGRANCGRKNPSYEVYVSAGEVKGNDGTVRGERITFSFRNKAYEVAKNYNFASVSSFELVGDDSKIFFKLSNESSRDAYTLSRGKKNPDQSTIQLTPGKHDLAIYKEKWAGGIYKIKRFGADIYYIDLEDRENH